MPQRLISALQSAPHLPRKKRSALSLSITLLLMGLPALSHGQVTSNANGNPVSYLVDNDEITTSIETIQLQAATVAAIPPPAIAAISDVPVARLPETAPELPAAIATPPRRSVITASDMRQIEVPVNPVVADSEKEEAPTDLWDRIRAGYAMEDLDDELVEKWERFYAERPDYINRIVDRSNRYMFYIVTELERRNMPLELALLPIIESAFNPVANSSAKAAGIWQFMPATGSQYGMKQDFWADSRRDVVSATNGAMDYLSYLYGMFGDWQLALASYNWGEGSVSRAVRTAKAAGKDGGYLSLRMPDETRNYLPKLQAVKNIISDPASFGLKIASIPNEPYFKTITLAQPIDLKRAAQLADLSEEEFVALNPAHHRPVIGGRSEEYQILLPTDRADLFLARLESNEKPRVSWMAYRTQPGDRIESLASRFGTTPAALRSANGIRSSTSQVPAGYHLLVPTDGPSEDALGSIQNAVFTKFPEYEPRSNGSTRSRVVVVRRGDTLSGIARQAGVSTADLMKWNRLSRQTVRVGQRLVLSQPSSTRTAVASKTTTPRLTQTKVATKKVGANPVNKPKLTKASTGNKTTVKTSKKSNSSSKTKK